MLNFLFLLQYCTLNGFLIHHFFIKDQHSTIVELLLSSIIISLSLNSLALYILVLLFQLPIIRSNVITLSLGLSIIILLTSFIKNTINHKP